MRYFIGPLLFIAVVIIVDIAMESPEPARPITTTTTDEFTSDEELKERFAFRTTLLILIRDSKAELLKAKKEGDDVRIAALEREVKAFEMELLLYDIRTTSFKELVSVLTTEG